MYRGTITNFIPLERTDNKTLITRIMEYMHLTSAPSWKYQKRIRKCIHETKEISKRTSDTMGVSRSEESARKIHLFVISQIMATVQKQTPRISSNNWCTNSSYWVKHHCDVTSELKFGPVLLAYYKGYQNRRGWALKIWKSFGA